MQQIILTWLAVAVLSAVIIWRELRHAPVIENEPEDRISPVDPTEQRVDEILNKASWHREQMMAMFFELCELEGVDPRQPSIEGRRLYMAIFCHNTVKDDVGEDDLV